MLSWTAFASFNANTFQTQGVAGFSATPAPIASSQGLAPESGNTSDPDESPSQAPSPAEQGSPITSEQGSSPVPSSPVPAEQGQEEGGDNL